MLRLVFSLTFALTLLGGCGYHFTGEGPSPQPGLKTIAIPVFENSTSEPDLGSMFAGALRRQFLQRGHIKVVPVEEAEAIFRGRITEIYSHAVAHHDYRNRVANRITLETRLYITLDLSCQDVKTGKIIWKDPKFTYYRLYRDVPNISGSTIQDPAMLPRNIAGFESRRVAEEFLASEMAERIHDRFLNNF